MRASPSGYAISVLAADARGNELAMRLDPVAKLKVHAVGELYEGAGTVAEAFAENKIVAVVNMSNFGLQYVRRILPLPSRRRAPAAARRRRGGTTSMQSDL